MVPWVGVPTIVGPVIILQGGRQPLRGPRGVGINEYGDRPTAEQGVGVGLIGGLAAGGPDAPDRSVVEQAIGQQHGRVNRVRATGAAQVEYESPGSLVSSCCAILRSSCGVLAAMEIFRKPMGSARPSNRRSQSPSGRLRMPWIVGCGSWPRVIVIVRDFASTGCRTLIVTSVPSSPRNRSIASLSDHVLGDNSVDFLDQVILLHPRSIGWPSREDLGDSR